MKNTPKNKSRRIALLLVLFAVCMFAACEDKTDKTKGAVDFDLAVMSDTMAYALANDMANIQPETYMGKTIRAQGPYYTVFYDVTGQYYHYLLINDVTVCCVAGLEFLYEGDLPEVDTVIQIEGVFDKYTELGETYYYIAVTSLVVV